MDEGMEAIVAELGMGPATPAPEQQTDAKVENDEGATVEAEAETGLENEGDEQSGEQEGEEGQEPEYAPELTEIEVDGKKYAVPADLKDGYLRQADYTRKTQEVAEMRKTAEARVAEAEQHFNTSQEVLQARAALMVHESQLEQFKDLNWRELEANDPVAAMSAWREFQQLKEAKGNIEGYLNEQHSQRSAKAEQETANRLRETMAFAEKEIPGWSPEIDNKITEFAEKHLGYTRDTLKAACSPAVYRTLHLAWLGHQSLQKQQAAAKPAPVSQAKPLTTVTAKANPSARRSEADMPMGEFAAWINKR